MDRIESIHNSEQHEKIAAGRIQTRLIVLTWVTLAIVLAAEIYWGNYFAVAITVTGGLFLLIPFWLIKHGDLAASGLIIVLFVLVTITALATNGKGIHDISMMAYPVVIIFAGLALDWIGVRRSLILTLLCIAWLVFGEASGLFQAQPLDKPDWADFIIICSILVVLSLVVNILVRNMRQNLEMAKLEIEHRKQVEDALRTKTEEIDHYFTASLDLFCIADKDGYFRRLNPQWEETLGYSLDELQGKPFIEFVHPDDKDSTLAESSRLIEQQSILNFENRYRCKDGSYRWIEWRSLPAGNLIYAAARDITERKHMEDQLRYQSTHDILTDIYNRSFFEAELTRLEGSRDYPISIIVGDVDGLKMTNDTQGHLAGDNLLIQAACIFGSIFRSEDVLARIGGDEFAVIMPHTDSPSVEKKVDCIREALSENNTDPSNIQVNISFGAATAEYGDLVGAFTLADKRMYQDKARRAIKPKPAEVS